MGRKRTYPRTSGNEWQRIVGIAAGSVTPYMVSGRMFWKQGRATPAASGQWHIYGSEKGRHFSKK